MNHTNRPNRIEAALLVATLIVTAAAACGSADDVGSGGAQSVATTSDTADLRATRGTDAVSYEADVLFVGGVALPQFPGYVESNTFKPPLGWPALNPSRRPTQTDITIESKTDVFDRPRVSAVILRQNQLATDQPEAGFAVAEEQKGLGQAPTVFESTTQGPDRTCRVRIKAGERAGEPTSGTGYSATVIAGGTARPSVAVWISGGGTETVEVERYSREIAEALCAPPAVSS